MELGHLFEAGMLICFGFSWPLNVIKAYKAKTAKGTSLAFILLIITGYIAGISAKFVNHQINYVLVVYFVNLAIVMCNVAVYFRNVALDKKRKSIELVEIENKESDMEKKYEYTQSEVVFVKRAEKEEKNGVILLGGSLDMKIPVSQLAHAFNFNFKIYNKSYENLSIKNAGEYFNQAIKPLAPEAVIVHLGENDISLFTNDSSAFDKYYLNLISEIKAVNKKARLAFVSIENSDNNKVVAEMNKHIRAIAQSELCAFINLDNAKLWNPEASKQAVAFAYNMGLNTRKPLNDVAEILYAYAYKELRNESSSQVYAG